MVGIEDTFYRVSESVGFVRVCVIVYEPPSSAECAINFPFDVSLFTNSSTAGVSLTNIGWHY